MKNQGKMYLEFKRRGCHSKIYLITYMEDRYVNATNLSCICCEQGV